MWKIFEYLWKTIETLKVRQRVISLKYFEEKTENFQKQRILCVYLCVCHKIPTWLLPLLAAISLLLLAQAAGGGWSNEDEDSSACMGHMLWRPDGRKRQSQDAQRASNKKLGPGGTYFSTSLFKYLYVLYFWAPNFPLQQTQSFCASLYVSPLCTYARMLPEKWKLVRERWLPEL